LVRACAVTLVAGFAGSGKSVLLAEWAHSHPERGVAWLSCDITDADQMLFWVSLIEALRLRDPTVGPEALDLVDSDREFGHDAIASLVNDLLVSERDVVLVLDDLHLVARSALETLASLIERLAPNTRIVLSTRSDPRLPLHRWRARGQLGEIRAADLRLAAVEVGQLLERIGVAISAHDAAVLADRTEGWAAGVQLAALSMRDETDPAEFVHAFAGTDRNVADFLIGEVLQRQPDDTVDFLLDTAVLDELSAALCDMITERSDSAAMLQRLEREYLFVISLDTTQSLYRYHHLFAELLQRMLEAERPGRALQLHRAASNWYSDHDDPRRAVRHAILAKDSELVATLLRRRTLTEYFTGNGEMIHEWIDELSRAHGEMPPELMLEYALALVLVGALDDGRACLARVERTVTDDAPAISQARLALTRAVLLVISGEVIPGVAAANQARALVAPGVDPSLDGTLAQVLIRCYVYTDDLTSARALYEHSRSTPGVSAPLEQVVLSGAFSQVELEWGDLKSAGDYAHGAIEDLARLGAVEHVGAGEAFTILAALAYEHDRLDEAEQLLERSVEILGTARPAYLALALIERARLCNARGDLTAAFAELDTARTTLPQNGRNALVDRVEAHRARFLAEGVDPQSARGVVAHLPPGRRRSIAEVRCHLAEQNADDARQTLERLASSTNTPRETLEVSLLDARIALIDGADNLETKLERVLHVARTTGFLRTVADEGHELVTALSDALHHQHADSYSDELAPILERVIASVPAQNVPLFAGVTLSERELAVLKYLSTRMATREIAAELFISMNTLGSHKKSIYRKLGVDSRTAATKSAQTLGIL
jgi:LuxR family maltose regulon positive regulatory protein